MRALILLAFVLGSVVGCGKNSNLGGGGLGSLPAPTTKLRLTDSDLYSAYRPDGDTYPKHPHEGQRVLCQTYGLDCYGVKAGSEHLVLATSNKLFQRPRVVFALRDGSRFQAGAVRAAEYLYFEGVLRGAVEFASRPWAAEWLALPDKSSLKNRFVLIEDAVLTSEPGP